MVVTADVPRPLGIALVGAFLHGYDAKAEILHHQDVILRVAIESRWVTFGAPSVVHHLWNDEAL